MSPLDISNARLVESVTGFEQLLVDSEGSPELIIAIYRVASGKQTVSFTTLLETGIRYGWVDTQTKRIDAERYAIRYVPRRPGSHWSVRNRAIARRLLDEDRMTANGRRTLPSDL